ncbi:hypothetical protein Lfu02_14060 [Longispora fulva]|uniref:Uncharacterized protein n=1 Tax=Longispora fulva TaxID=619741 RepID=A0A8J7KMK0_9ACTN|nr:hypothetical protein [Longispora fulva]MBG6140584.1 hypothetical protein [Longispora fulva]GIG57034.1 hypothetical protein Lfu02_14060 [Longispora fulva]
MSVYGSARPGPEADGQQHPDELADPGSHGMGTVLPVFGARAAAPAPDPGIGGHNAAGSAVVASEAGRGVIAPDAGRGVVARPAATTGATAAAATASAAAINAAQAAAAAAYTTPTAAVSRGTVYTRQSPGDAQELEGSATPALPPLRIGAHIASEEALDMIRVPVAGAGLLLGNDRNRAPVSIRMFRPEPTRVSLVGDQPWSTKLLVFRALALGARVVVFTHTPGPWQALAQWATGHNDRLAVLPTAQPVEVQGTAQTPALLVYELGDAGTVVPPSLGPWQTQLTVLPQLSVRGFPAVQASNLVMMSRLSGTEAQAITSILRLDPRSAGWLERLHGDMLALVGGGADRYVWVTPTNLERQHLGLTPSRA